MARVSFHVIHRRTILAAAFVILLLAAAVAAAVYGTAQSRWETMSTVFWRGVMFGRSFLAALPSSEAVPVTALPLHRPAPPFTLTDTTGRTVDLTSFIGRPVVLVFWAAWCPDCASQMRALASVHSYYRSRSDGAQATPGQDDRSDGAQAAPGQDDRSDAAQGVRGQGDAEGVAIVAVNLMEDAGTVRKFTEQHLIPFPMLLDPDAAVSNAYLVRITPTIILIDKDGIVRDRLFGLIDRDTIIARVEGLL